MDAYKEALTEYRITLQTTAGCGERAQDYITNAYQKLQTAYNSLTVEEKTKVRLPKCAICDDDGTGGMATGLATFAQNMRRR